MAVADVYDALISRRIYKESMQHDKAVAIILEGNGSHFDPDMVDAFIDIQSEFQAIAARFVDTNHDFRPPRLFSKIPLKLLISFMIFGQLTIQDKLVWLIYMNFYCRLTVFPPNAVQNSAPFHYHSGEVCTGRIFMGKSAIHNSLRIRKSEVVAKKVYSHFLGHHIRCLAAHHFHL